MRVHAQHSIAVPWPWLICLLPCGYLLQHLHTGVTFKGGPAWLSALICIQAMLWRALRRLECKASKTKHLSVNSIGRVLHMLQYNEPAWC